MNLLVSACLLGENCKYSGGNNRNEQVIRFAQGHNVIAVCPEVLGGLPTPRVPAEIVNGVVTNRLGEVVDGAFREGVARALERIDGAEIDLAILQPRSPSCGSREVYDGTFTGTLRAGQGLLAQALAQRGIPMVDADRLETVEIGEKKDK